MEQKLKSTIFAVNQETFLKKNYNKSFNKMLDL